MKLYSWNVNGFRAVVKKDFWQWFRASDADVVCLQETKAAPDQVDEADKSPHGYQSFFNGCKVKKGYSGTAVYYRRQPLKIATGLPQPQYQGEGRLIHLEYPALHLLGVYFPNGQKDEERLQFKLGYYDAFLEYAQTLRKTKPVVVCGDFNTAHRPIDLARPKDNENVSGFLSIERAWLDRFTAAGYVDTLRLVHGDKPTLYTWWSHWAKARERNVGWRIDYFFVSEELKTKVKNAWIEPGVLGSDHCPVGLELLGSGLEL